MATIEQIRAARALLGWSQQDLADRANLSQTGIARIENGAHKPNSHTLEKILSAFDAAGLEFLGNRGVQKKRLEIEIYSGEQEYGEFFDDVYDTVKRAGGDIVISGVEETSFASLAPETVKNHQERMEKLDNYAMRCLICEGDTNFSASRYCQYRWTPKHLFESVPFYVYGEKLALMNFEEAVGVRIFVIQNRKIADAFRKQFAVQWQNALIPPKKGGKGA